MIITLTGSNSFLLKAELKRLVSDFVKQYGDLALEKLDGEEVEYQQIVESLQALPFLSAKKLVVLSTPSTQKAFAESFEKLVETISDSTNVIIVEPKLDKRLSYSKFLAKKTEFKEFNELDDNGLARWLVQEAKNQKGSLNPAEARYLVERIGLNQQLLNSELQKLLDYNPAITKESIDLLTEPTPQSKIFELLDAAFNGQTKRTFALYNDQRQQQVEPMEMIGMIAWQLHILALVKTAGNRSSDEIARTAKIHPFVVGKSQNIVRRLGLGELKKLINNLLEIDMRLKSEAIDPDEALQNYLLAITMATA